MSHWHRSTPVPIVLWALAALAVTALSGTPPLSGRAAAQDVAADAIFASDSSSSTSPRLVEVLAVGRPAPGFEPGAVVSAVGPPPMIAADGSVSAVVGVSSSAGQGQALYRAAGGTPQLAAWSGAPAPGTSDEFTGFPEVVPQTPKVHAGRLTFAGSLEGGLHGVWSERTGTPALLLLQGQQLPGMPAGAGVFSFSFLMGGDAVLLEASYVEGTSSSPADEGLWRNRSGAWERVIINGQQAPGLEPGVVFDTDPLSTYGPLFAIRAKGDGRIVAQAWVSGSRIDEDNDEALWVETSSGLGILVREGSTSPAGGTFGPTLSSPTFGGDGENIIPAVNDTGAIVFGAVLRGRDGRLNSVWTNRSGQLQLLARGSIPISGFGRGDQAPGFPSGATYGTFEASAIDASGRIAVEGFADVNGNLNDLTKAVWWDRPGPMTLVAREGGAVPGIPGATFFDVDLVALAADGALFFTGRLQGTGIHAGNDAAAFRVVAGQTPVLVLREGEPVAVVDAAGAATRTIASFELGRGVATDGRRAARVSFTDGGAGLYVVEPPPAGGGCTPTEPTEASCGNGLDDDCDGAIDGDDLDCAGVCAPTQSRETSCGNGLDDDCDGLIDAADPDCAPTCRPSRASCSSDAQCCSGQCRGKPGKQTCR